MKLHPNRARWRRGMSLNETLVVIPVSMAVLGVVSMTTAMLLRSEGGTVAIGPAPGAARLARALRADLHAAQSASWQAGTLRLDPAAGPPVTYRVEQDRVVRRSGEPPAVTATHALPAGDRLEAGPPDPDSPRLFTVRVVSSTGQPRTTVTALVGRLGAAAPRTNPAGESP